MPPEKRQRRQPPVRSRTGTIAVVTTERGLPTALKIDRSELARPPQDLAAEILALCKYSALRAQVAFRRELLGKGFTPSSIREIGLPTEEDLARAEAELFADDDDDPPATWMRSV
ncbi:MULTISPECIES: hypothetical protein [Mycobacterium]|uniref:hypothetical protein n=1 Tax=Mycobacterium TaxID=1763 RepID=UPI001EEF8A4B|nr:MULTISPECIES: hypothetical protein [Mycobacterium]GLB93057.1 hypothetical protein SRL2020130_58740 [Mycobacterium kiyosense]GLC15755.1 hypothetical protein SRL2020448_43580 [Mycobacterium kiyosense]GLD09654.1 hypothetical protein Mkiyose1383_59800 [Mycobacterium kiyosense]GLD15762.1 hypothetical protein Mkiyose1384_59970 [Mycobacterium kiyosense]